MKSRRQSAILELVDVEAITSQEQLRERLRLRGIEATQATLSRDIRDLGLIKRAADGAYIAYRGKFTGIFKVRWPLHILRGVIGIGMLSLFAFALKSLPLADTYAIFFDRASLPEIVGTIAGDDTILVICRSAPDAAGLSKRLDGWRTS